MKRNPLTVVWQICLRELKSYFQSALAYFIPTNELLPALLAVPPPIHGINWSVTFMIGTDWFSRHGFTAVDLGYQPGNAVSNLVNKVDEPPVTATRRRTSASVRCWRRMAACPVRCW